MQTKTNIDRDEYRALRFLYKNGWFVFPDENLPVRMKFLAKYMKLPTNEAKEVLLGMEDNGYVRTELKGSHIFYYLTNKGVRAFEDANDAEIIG